jgi:putative ABC transport system substrate-binding protein
VRAVFATLPDSGIDGVLLWSSTLFDGQATEIGRLATEHRIIAMLPWKEYAQAGGLIAYAPDILAIWRRAATYVDRILRGAKPGDLPVEQPTKFDLVINMRTAKALGLTVPAALLVRAEQVLE